MGVDTVEAIIADGAAQMGVALDGETASRLARYAQLVVKWRRLANLTNANTAIQFAREHIVDSLAVLPFLHGPRILDVGSGAGLPGLVVAIARPEFRVTLLEPRAKRSRFLTQARIELAMERLDVIPARVEAHEPALPYDEIIARALAPFATFVESTRALHAPGTRLLAMKSAFDPAEIGGTGLDPSAVRIKRLRVPGFRERCLVVVDFTGPRKALPDTGEGV